jgi:hypothetical protein
VGDVVALRIVGVGAAIGARHGCEGGFEWRRLRLLLLMLCRIGWW